MFDYWRFLLKNMSATENGDDFSSKTDQTFKGYFENVK